MYNFNPQVKTTIGLAGASSPSVGVWKFASSATDQNSQPALALSRSARTEPSLEANIGISSRRRLYRSLNHQCRTGRSPMIVSKMHPCRPSAVLLIYCSKCCHVCTLTCGWGRCEHLSRLAWATFGMVITPVVIFTLASVTQHCPSNGSTTSNSLWYTSLCCFVLRCELWVTCWCRCHTSGDWMCIRPLSDLWKGSILFGATSHWPNRLCSILMWDASRRRTPCHTSLCFWWSWFCAWASNMVTKLQLCSWRRAHK